MLRTHRASAYESLRKWDIFRERREAEIDRYVSARRRQARAEQSITQLRTFFYLRTFAQFFTEHKQKVTFKLKVNFLIFRLQQNIEKRNAKKFGGFAAKKKNHLRHQFTLFAMQLSAPADLKARETILTPFIQEYLYRSRLKHLFRRSWGQLRYIQQKLQAQLSMNHGKLEALESYWDDHLQKINKQAIVTKDKATAKMTAQVMGMDADLKRHFLRIYLRKCKQKHKLAFVQWRQLYSPRAEVS